MKNFKQLFVFVIAIAITMFSCNKENENTNSEEFDNLTFNKFRTIDIITTDVLDDYDGDVDKKRYSYNSYYIGEALSNVNWTKEFKTLLVEDAKNSVLKEANLNRICEKSDDFKNELNAQIDKINKGATLKSLSNTMIINNDKFEPIIVIPNLEKLDLNFEPIISHGVEIEEETVDDILAIFIHENKSKSQIKLNEKEAVLSIKPVFIFDYGLNDENYIGKNVFLDENKIYNYDNLYSGSIDSVVYKSSNKIFLNIHTSIKNQAFFYDPRGKNEYTQRAFFWANNNDWVAEVYGTSGDRLRTIKQFSESECNGTQFTTWGGMVDFQKSINAPNIPYDMFTYRTYERDWSKGQKDLSTTTYGGKVCRPYGKMKFSDEWYMNNNAIYNVPTTSPYTLWQYVDIQNYKTKAAFTRSN